MFSFGGHSHEEEENTPFFEDNEQKPSLFSSQLSEEMSAFELFNDSSCNSMNFKADIEKARESKKSIILELDQFDRKEAFRTLEEAHSALSELGRTEEKELMAESQVKHFQSSQLFSESQLQGSSSNENKDKGIGKINFLNKFKLNIKGSKLSSTIEDSKAIPSLKIAKSNQEAAKVSIQQASLQSERFSLQNKNLQKSSLKQKEKGDLPSKSTANQHENALSAQDKAAAKPEPTGFGKKFTFNPLNFQDKMKATMDLKNSKVGLEVKGQDGPQKQKIKQSTGRPMMQSLRINFGAMLGKSRAKQVEQKKEQVPPKPVPNIEKTPIISVGKQPPRQQQKSNKPRQKPCFNLKLIKESGKPEHKMEVEKKTEVNNVIKEQLLNKREEIATAKILKDGAFGKGLNFQFGGLKTAAKDDSELKQSDGTPKVARLEQKNFKIFVNRQTEKLKQQSMPNPEPELPELSNPNHSIHRVDYEKYENEINSLYQEIEQTKKKSSSSDEGFRGIFLLLNKANMILNERFMSQTQGNEAKDKAQ